MRFIEVLSDFERTELCKYLCRQDLLVRERKRFTMLSLSSIHKMSIDEIAASCSVSRDTVKNVFNRFEQAGFEGLLDKEAHKQSSLASYDERLILRTVKKNPQSLQKVLADLSSQGIDTNKSILKRYLKKRLYLAKSS